MEKQFNYFNNLKAISNDEASVFISTLYHDDKSGYSCIGEKSVVGYNQTFKKTNNLDLTDILKNYNKDFYISVNTFSSKNRRKTNLFNRSTIYIDIDLHKKIVSDNDIKSVCDILTNAYDNNLLSIPTMITFTGRGFGIYYILEKSINCNIKSTEKMRTLFELTYQSIVNKYEKVLQKTCPQAEIDKSVMDGSRIVRIPSTKNSKNNKICHLIFLNKKNDGSISYVKNFRDIVTIDNILTENNKKNNEGEYKGSKISTPFIYNTKNDVVYSEKSTIYMLNNRIKMLFNLAELRKNNDNAFRELLCHMVYNFGIQTGRSEKDCLDLVLKLNNIFSCPLPEYEINAAISSVSYNHNYNYTTKQIINKLNITAEECKLIGLTDNNRKLSRAKEKYNKQVAKEQKRFEIACYIKEHPDIKICQISEMFDMSRTSINNIIKEYGVNRNKCANSKISTIYEIEDIYNKKVQKFGTILWCVIDNTNLDPSSELLNDENNNEIDNDILDITKEKDVVEKTIEVNGLEKKDTVNNIICFNDKKNQKMIHYCNSFLNFLIDYSKDGYKRAFHFFYDTFNHYIQTNNNSNNMIKAVTLVAKQFENELLPENAIIPLNYLFVVMNENKRLTSRSRIPLLNSSISLNTSLSVNALLDVFHYNPSSPLIKPPSIKKNDGKKNFKSFKTKEEYRYISYKIEKLPIVLNEAKDNWDMSFDMFDYWFDTATSNSTISGLSHIEKHLSVSSMNTIKQFFRYVVNNCYNLDGESVYPLLLEYFGVTNVYDLSIKVKPRTKAQEEAYHLYNAQKYKWDYIREHKSNTTKAFAQLYSDIKEFKKNNIEKVTINSITYDLDEFKKKYLYHIIKEDLIAIELKYNDNISTQDLLIEIIEKLS